MYNLCDYYDVWGNENDGYEIFNWRYPYGRDFGITDDLSSDEKIVTWLKENKHLKDNVTSDMLDIVDECNGLIMIYQFDTGMPLFCLEYQT